MLGIKGKEKQTHSWNKVWDQKKLLFIFPFLFLKTFWLNLLG